MNGLESKALLSFHALRRHLGSDAERGAGAEGGIRSRNAEMAGAARGCGWSRLRAATGVVLLLTTVTNAHSQASTTSEPTLDSLFLESHARFLAHDLLEGRGPASRGERLAALYLETRPAAMGVRPVAGAGYRLAVPLTAVDIDEAASSMRLITSGETRVLRPPAFYHPGGGRASFTGFAGEAVFPGTASDQVTALARSGALAGKVVVLEPPLGGAYGVYQDLLAGGASGAIALVPDSTFYGRLRIVRGPTRYHLPDGVADPANQTPLPTVVGGAELVRALGLDDTGGPPSELSVAIDVPLVTEARIGYNVLGYVEGSDPALRAEWVVYVAHYDHVGFGEPTAGDSIWNGFVDNAAGTAILLEVARSMSADPP
ncbi:MAG: M28 family peptidase, partial [Gemmatimonadota bacterium]